MGFNLNSYMAERQELINRGLDKYLPIEGDYPKEIAEAMRYSVFAGGKRIRPILVLAACEIVGGNLQNAMKVACSIEFIHTYSLIHDDLPAMDDDDIRRGIPTCHIIYGEALAILAGDALLTYAFELLAECNNVDLIKEISIASGPKGMIAGQVADILAERNQNDKSKELLEYIHHNKTGALIKASVISGGLIGGAMHKQQLQALNSYANHFGLAFQITDDILDLEGDFAELGKKIGSDEKNQKLTYPLLYGIEKSKKMALDNVNLACDNLKIFGDKAVPLISLAKSLLTRRS